MVAICSRELQAIECAELFNFLERAWSERNLALESVQNNAFQQITKCHVSQLRQGLQYLEQAFFHSNAGLNTLNIYEAFGRWMNGHMYQCTMVHWLSQLTPPIFSLSIREG